MTRTYILAMRYYFETVPPRFGVDLNATDVNLFMEDVRRFGANLWESDELFTPPPNASQRIERMRPYVT